MTTAEKAKQYFEENKETNELFATSDGFLFLQKKDAQNHAQTLEDSTVEEFKSEASKQSDASDKSESPENSEEVIPKLNPKNPKK
nr:MAG TPA: hypothetical protein [Caudoviricetes sp.]